MLIADFSGRMWPDQYCQQPSVPCNVQFSRTSIDHKHTRVCAPCTTILRWTVDVAAQHGLQCWVWSSLATSRLCCCELNLTGHTEWFGKMQNIMCAHLSLHMARWEEMARWSQFGGIHFFSCKWSRLLSIYPVYGHYLMGENKKQQLPSSWGQDVLYREKEHFIDFILNWNNFGHVNGLSAKPIKAI